MSILDTPNAALLYDTRMLADTDMLKKLHALARQALALTFSCIFEQRMQSSDLFVLALGGTNHDMMIRNCVDLVS